VIRASVVWNGCRYYKADLISGVLSTFFRGQMSPATVTLGHIPSFRFYRIVPKRGRMTVDMHSIKIRFDFLVENGCAIFAA